ncbi:hypothetical protein IEQ34_011432 [Dendrobium chrysotoxum]|uniref:Uncharacterized protein n=1 Tax=Dendrobium chrysotoxum TaxID=161865 RepID=A0AAV7GS82_DENCH|nr:hypothetical protein IEQ34_011432 [Dendrobium chrysotoxum]
MGNPRIKEVIGDAVRGLELLECIGFRIQEKDGEKRATYEAQGKGCCGAETETMQRLLPEKKSEQKSIDRKNPGDGRQELRRWSVARELPNSSLLSEASVEIVVKLLRNIHTGNQRIKEVIGDAVGGLELLECVGFRIQEKDGEKRATYEAQGKGCCGAETETMQRLVPEKKSEQKSIDRKVVCFLCLFFKGFNIKLNFGDFSFFSPSTRRMRNLIASQSKL